MTTPEYARQACRLRLAATDRKLTLEDLEVLSAVRGEQIVTCDEKRDLADLANVQQQAALDEWEKQRALRRCPIWRFGTCKPPQ